jgi:hypothetical protein
MRTAVLALLLALSGCAAASPAAPRPMPAHRAPQPPVIRRVRPHPDRTSVLSVLHILNTLEDEIRQARRQLWQVRRDVPAPAPPYP